MIDLRYVKKLVEMLDESSVDSIEISTDRGMKIRISKTPQQRGTVQVAPPMSIPMLVPYVSSALRATPTEGAPAVGEAMVPKTEPKSKWLELKSPTVGNFYMVSAPGPPAFVTA